MPSGRLINRDSGVGVLLTYPWGYVRQFRFDEAALQQGLVHARQVDVILLGEVFGKGGELLRWEGRHGAKIFATKEETTMNGLYAHEKPYCKTPSKNSPNAVNVVSR